MKNAQRGAVLVETALTIFIILSLLYGGTQLGIVGVEQLRADGAAFTSSHAQALNVSEPTTGAADPAAKAAGIYNGVANTDVALASGKPPTTAESVNYDFTNTQGRHGGVSMLLPIQIVSTVLRKNVNNIVLGTTGSLFTLSGSTIDPAYLEVGAHGDIQGNAFNSTAAFNDRNDYFSQGENTPPYFVGFHYLTFCENTSSWNGCPTNQQDYDAVGLAEYLDADNWGRASNGSVPNAVFTATLGHQNTFAEIAGALANAPSAQALYTNGALRWNQGVLDCIYNKWDSRQAGGYPNNYTAVGQYPLNPDVKCNVGP
jgi:hypothetical protein